MNLYVAELCNLVTCKTSKSPHRVIAVCYTDHEEMDNNKIEEQHFE